MGNTIYASFAEPELAERAAGALLDSGVVADDISIVQGHRGDFATKNYGSGSLGMGMPDENRDAPYLDERIIGRPNLFAPPVTESASQGYTSTAMEADTRDLATPRDSIGSETDYRMSDDADSLESSAKHGISTTTPEDAEAGAMKGAAWGAGVGVIAALAALAIPGFGLVLGGGALAIAIGGVVAATGAGAAAGAVTGYLKDQGVDGHVAENYERSVYGGGALLAVTVPSGPVGEFEARTLMEKYGASNVNIYASRGYLA